MSCLFMSKMIKKDITDLGKILIMVLPNYTDVLDNNINHNVNIKLKTVTTCGG